MPNTSFVECKAARLKINEEFKRNKNETSDENIKEVFDTIIFSLAIVGWITVLLTFR